jgi:hypothetical protein
VATLNGAAYAAPLQNTRPSKANETLSQR